MPLIKADRFIALKNAVKAEMQRRNGTGSVSSYGGTAYDYTVTPKSGQVVLKEYLTKNGVPLSKINSNIIADPSSTAGRIIKGTIEYSPTSSNPVNPTSVTAGDISKMEAAVAYWRKISPTVPKASTGCLSSCTGLCATGCSIDCDGSCSGDCDTDCWGRCADACLAGDCSGRCFGDCEGDCIGDCADSCTGMCWDGAN